MYSLAQYPTDSFLWEFIAYCAGTSGPILIIGSAAGVAARASKQFTSFGTLSGSAVGIARLSRWRSFDALPPMRTLTR
jgi:Na+/H+ antiporter NhaD/arsenite permease-like protein